MKTCHICESTSESAEIDDSSRKRVIAYEQWTIQYEAYEQWTIQYEQTYKLLKSNLLSLTVGFEWIDGSHNKDNRLNI